MHGGLHVGHLRLGDPSTGPGGGTELSVPVISGFLGASGFGAAIVASLLPGRGHTGVLVAVAAGLLAAPPTGWLAGRLVNAAMNISTDGASALLRSVAANVAQRLQLGSDLTSIDLPALLAGERKIGDGKLIERAAD